MPMNAMELEGRHSAHNYEPLPVVLARGQGAYVWDTSGRRYIDMMSAYSAVSHGHAHPRLVAALQQAFRPGAVAVLVEAIQGEAGIIVPPAGWLSGVRLLCDAHRLMMMVDEVQSGLGRTGAWFAFEHEKVRPDGVILGKALGGGLLPVSAFVARRELMDVFTPGSHGSTFACKPLAAALR